MRKTYISGPMTGLPEHNFPAFNLMADQLRSLGFDVVNPAEFTNEGELPWEEYLRRDIKALMDCDCIAMLKGWSKSRGATLEHHIAMELGFDVLYESDK